MSLLNWGGGLAAAGTAISGFAHDAGLVQQKADLEQQTLTLANQLKEGSDIKLEGIRNANQTGLIHTTAEEARTTAGATAEAQGTQARQTAGYENTLPMTAAQTATNKIQKQEADARTLEASKPVAGGYTGSWMVPDKTAPLGWKMVNASSDAAPRVIDKDSNNLSTQVGLSDMAIKQMTGQMKGVKLPAAQSMMVSKEIEEWGRKNNINTNTLAPQVEAQFKIMESNLQRNNQGKVLEDEIAGTIKNSADLADSIGQGQFKVVNGLRVWAGKQDNDPKTIQAADQIMRLRNEVASYNAVAGGHLMANGTPEPTPQDYREAEELIANGINSGGLKALGESVAMSAEKNRQVLSETIDNSNREYYKLFGATYKAPERAPTQPVQTGDGAATGSANPAAKTPPIPAWVKPGDLYSPSRGKARDAQGKEYGPPAP